MSNTNTAINATNTADLAYDATWLTIRLFICFVGITNSCLLMIVVWKDGSTSVGARLLICSLFFSETLLCGVFLPGSCILAGVPSLSISRSAQSTVCPMHMGIQFFLMTFSFTDVSLGINRLIAVCFPHNFSTWQSTRACCVMVGTSWFVALLTVILPAFDIGGSYIVIPGMHCVMVAHNQFTAAAQLLMGAIPYSLVGLLSIVIFTTVYLKRKQLKQNPSTTARFQYQLVQKHLVIAKAMAVLLIVNLTTSLPYIVTLSVSPAMFGRPLVRDALTTLPTISYALNPLVFFTVSRAYRQALRLMCGCPNTQEIHPVIMVSVAGAETLPNTVNS